MYSFFLLNVSSLFPCLARSDFSEKQLCGSPKFRKTSVQTENLDFLEFSRAHESNSNVGMSQNTWLLPLFLVLLFWINKSWNFTSFYNRLRIAQNRFWRSCIKVYVKCTKSNYSAFSRDYSVSVLTIKSQSSSLWSLVVVGHWLNSIVKRYWVAVRLAC